ncbi:phospholipid methyltransferase [Gemmatirosa kalamazoonensis]|uniref:Phospholipid methyltransferase n=2 Tax=Gemmatirosa kalamazoonensis TaxID=861299 RepID=W0RFW6_9BACT|nr:phospholipid methyltransferase [Gemmatirosa kalamazoonensis]
MLIRHLLSIVLLPVMMAGLVPQWLLRANREVDTRWPPGALGVGGRVLGALLLVAGFALFAWCVTLFARVGKGTLAPWDPTTRLVAVGPYRYVRNPMITSVCTMLAGQALLVGSRVLGLWFATFLVLNHLFFLAIEEPGLEERFGEPYREYRRRVPRWIPRLR